MSDDHFEPVYGLPGFLPAGEKILWQGAPDWKGLAFRALRVREVLAYFAFLIVLELVRRLGAGDLQASALSGLVVTAVLGSAACIVLGVIAYLSARTTVYTVTNRRVAIRTGIAFTFTINLPFVLLDSVDVATRRGGGGDVLLTLARGERLSYAMCWPSVRPWHYRYPQPLLRCIPQAQRVGELIARAVAETGATVSVRRRTEAEVQTSPPREAVAA